MKCVYDYGCEEDFILYKDMYSSWNEKESLMCCK